MTQELKSRMSQASFFYGPMSNDEMRSIPVPAFATQIRGAWYAGTYVAVDSLAGSVFTAPVEVVEVVTEQPPADAADPLNPYIEGEVLT